jgi:naphthoate synthase
VIGISNLGVGGLSMFYETDESLEGKSAFMKKRKPDYAKFRGK